MDKPEVLIRDLQNRIRSLETTSRVADNETVVSSGSSAIDALLPAGGFARGSLVEWFSTPAARESRDRPLPQHHAPKHHSPKHHSPKHHAPKHRASAGIRKAGRNRTRQPGTRNTVLEEGGGATSLALNVAREACRSGGILVVLDPEQTFYPPALLAHGFSANQVVVLRPQSEQDVYWSLQQALSCPAVAAAWCRVDRLEERVFRRLQLAAETSGCLGLLERPARATGEPSWSEIQLGVSPLARAEWFQVESKQGVEDGAFRLSGSQRSGLNPQKDSGIVPRRHPRHFSANRFLQIQLLRSRQGPCGQKALVEIDSWNGEVRPAPKIAPRAPQPASISLARSLKSPIQSPLKSATTKSATTKSATPKPTTAKSATPFQHQRFPQHNSPDAAPASSTIPSSAVDRRSHLHATNRKLSHETHRPEQLRNRRSDAYSQTQRPSRREQA